MRLGPRAKILLFTEDSKGERNRECYKLQPSGLKSTGHTAEVNTSKGTQIFVYKKLLIYHTQDSTASRSQPKQERQSEEGCVNMSHCSAFSQFPATYLWSYSAHLETRALYSVIALQHLLTHHDVN